MVFKKCSLLVLSTSSYKKSKLVLTPGMEEATFDCPTVSKVAFGVENCFSVSNSDASRFR